MHAADAVSPATDTVPPRVWRAVVAASIGNALEWFDLVVYGFFAITISRLFFPAGNDTVSLLLTLGTFGVSFFMRPLGATAFLAEHVPGRRGFFASWQVASQGLTTLLAAIFGTALNAGLTSAQMAAWGWRVPFCFGLLLGPVAYYIRSKVDETPEFLASTPAANPLRDTFAAHKGRLAAAIGAVVLGTVATYLVLFMPTYGVKELKLAPSAAFAAILVVGVIQMGFAPVVGHWSDRHGRVRTMCVPALAILVLIYPAFAWLAAHPTFGALIAVQIVFAFLMTGYFAALPGLLSEIFPVATRTTGMSLAYNVAVTVFG